MSTNFIQWNSAALNQETDAEYLADAQRIGGVTTGSLAPSATMNKFYYQASTFIAAFGQMLATKGYSNSDASLPTLAAVLANVLTEADMGAQIVSVPYSPTPAFNAAGNNGFQMTLTGNITASTISGVSPGQLLAFYFVQDSVGGRTVSWPSSFVGALQPDAAASSVSVMLFRADLSGTVRAVSPLISNNYLFGVTPLLGDSSKKIATTEFVSSSISALQLQCIRTNKIGTYSAGITYTNNSGAAVFEEVTMVGIMDGSSGSDHWLKSTINGVAGPSSSFTNSTSGYAYVGFWVPNGGTFSVTITDHSGGGPSTIYSWSEVSF